jgi:hypothetical protein
MLNFGKVKETRLWGVTAQFSDVRMPIGDSAADTHTSFPNPLRGTLFWDRCQYILSGVTVNGGATGGSYTITIETDALRGYTALPIARVRLGPLSTGRIVMDSLHRSAGSPMPTHLNIDSTITAGATQALSFQVHCFAKQYRGVLGSGGGTSERILQGSLAGNQAATSAAGDFTTDTTLTIGITDTNIGMGRMRLWDNAMFWAIAGSTVSGTWEVDVVGRCAGGTFTIATSGTTGNISATGNKFALANATYGQAINPSHVIVTEVSAGTINALEVIGIAKSGRGSLAKD